LSTGAGKENETDSLRNEPCTHALGEGKASPASQRKINASQKKKKTKCGRFCGRTQLIKKELAPLCSGAGLSLRRKRQRAASCRKKKVLVFSLERTLVLSKRREKWKRSFCSRYRAKKKDLHFKKMSCSGSAGEKRERGEGIRKEKKYASRRRCP